MNIWQSYKQKRDCLVHFLRLLAVCWPGAQRTWHVLKWHIFAYLKQHLPPVIKEMLSDTSMFQQDNALAHQTPDTLELLSHATPH